MNKKLLIFGASALVTGFLFFSSFDKKTREQQMAEIEQMVTMKLDELRAQKEQECTDKIDAEAQRRFDEILAQREAEAAAKPGKKPKPKPKPGSTGGSTVDPLPQPTPPATDPKKDKMEGGTNTQEKKDKMQGQPTTTDKKKEKMKSGGGGK